MNELAHWIEFAQECEAEIGKEYGPMWRTEHGLVEGQSGEFFCRLCGKTLPDVSRVMEHCGSQKHRNKHKYVAWQKNPLGSFPEEQRRFLDVERDGTVRCLLCAGRKVCTEAHMASTMHELFLYRSYEIKYRKVIVTCMSLQHERGG